MEDNWSARQHLAKAKLVLIKNKRIDEESTIEEQRSQFLHSLTISTKPENLKYIDRDLEETYPDFPLRAYYKYFMSWVKMFEQVFTDRILDNVVNETGNNAYRLKNWKYFLVLLFQVDIIFCLQ